MHDKVQRGASPPERGLTGTMLFMPACRWYGTVRLDCPYMMRITPSQGITFSVTTTYAGGPYSSTITDPSTTSWRTCASFAINIGGSCTPGTVTASVSFYVDKLVASSASTCANADPANANKLVSACVCSSHIHYSLGEEEVKLDPDLWDGATRPYLGTPRLSCSKLARC